MSYCRWSSCNFACDLYVYEDASGGWTIHVAGARVLGIVPKVEWPAQGDESLEAIERFVATQADQTDFIIGAEREAIRLPHAGETFNEPTAAACADRIEELIALGYRAPASVIVDLRAEAPP